ncbi:Trafficking protein particle complex subunit 4 [Halotydeus destructor]|nr:Trafficking protein particle complex subunit 4 [Halotydeus destructor]
MVVFNVYIISKSGGLIYSHDHTPGGTEIEKTFSYPLDLKLEYINQRVAVTFGQRDGVRVGYSILAINGEPVTGRKVGDRDVLDDILANESNYPLAIKLGIPRLSANEKIVLASMFHSMFAIAALQLSGSKSGTKFKPPSSSGIEALETENFKLNCFQTLTGVKFVVISDLFPSPTSKEVLLRKIYEVYSDYALKNPFYSLDMPIRCELFDIHLKALLDQAERTGLQST